MSLLDVHRFDSLSDKEVVRRIGTLLSIALMRSGALSAAGVTAPVRQGPAKLVAPAQLLTDPRDQRIVSYLECTGEARPRELAVTLGLSRGVLQRRLLRLRAIGICQVAGMTRSARYSLKADHSAN